MDLTTASHEQLSGTAAMSAAWSEATRFCERVMDSWFSLDWQSACRTHFKHWPQLANSTTWVVRFIGGCPTWQLGAT
jgi:hypothetical protein